VTAATATTTWRLDGNRVCIGIVRVTDLMQEQEAAGSPSGA
jgi:hypothetical protein